MIAGSDVPARGPLARLRRVSIRRLLGAILVLQIGLALALALPDLDIERLLEGSGPIRTSEVEPVTPGSQTRPYSPRVLPRRADGNPGSGPVTLPRELDALEFSRTDHPDFGPVLLLAGSIGEGDAARFARELDELPQEVGTLMLHSPGGMVEEALEIGALVRERGMNTAVLADGACLSACPLILFAGVERLIAPQAWIGMHQAYYPASTVVSTAAAITSVQSLQGRVLEYTDAMGVDPVVHVHALATPPEEAYFLVSEELLRYRVATEMLEDAPEA